MKKILMFIVLIVSVVLSSCDGIGDVFDIVNRTEVDLIIVWGYNNERNDSTIIINRRSGTLSSTMTEFGTIPPNSNAVYDIFGGWWVQSQYCDKYIDLECHGLMRFFIVKESDVARYGWKKVVEEDMVLQRYDFTDKDLEMIDRKVYFPPTPTMQNINMWPPYDTYTSGYPNEYLHKLSLK